MTDSRTGVPRTGGERETLRAYLDFHRETLALKCAGLSDDDLRRRTTTSSLTLLGLVRHMAEVERAWFGAYDHVALCQLWGAMPALPRPIPRFTRELRQRWDDVGQPALPPKPTGTHDALVDARYNLERWNAMEAVRR